MANSEPTGAGIPVPGVKQVRRTVNLDFLGRVDIAIEVDDSGRLLSIRHFLPADTSPLVFRLVDRAALYAGSLTIAGEHSGQMAGDLVKGLPTGTSFHIEAAMLREIGAVQLLHRPAVNLLDGIDWRHKAAK